MAWLLCPGCCRRLHAAAPGRRRGSSAGGAALGGAAMHCCLLLHGWPRRRAPRGLQHQFVNSRKGCVGYIATGNMRPHAAWLFVGVCFARATTICCAVCNTLRTSRAPHPVHCTPRWRVPASRVAVLIHTSATARMSPAQCARTADWSSRPRDGCHACAVSEAAHDNQQEQQHASRRGAKLLHIHLRLSIKAPTPGRRLTSALQATSSP